LQRAIDEKPLTAAFFPEALFAVRDPPMVLSFPPSSTVANAIERLNGLGFMVHGLFDPDRPREKLPDVRLLGDFAPRIFAVGWESRLAYIQKNQRTHVPGAEKIKET
jgi:hypothetical protein